MICETRQRRVTALLSRLQYCVWGKLTSYSRLHTSWHETQYYTTSPHNNKQTETEENILFFMDVWNEVTVAPPQSRYHQSDRFHKKTRPVEAAFCQIIQFMWNSQFSERINQIMSCSSLSTPPTFPCSSACICQCVSCSSPHYRSVLPTGCRQEEIMYTMMCLPRNRGKMTAKANLSLFISGLWWEQVI